MKRDESPWWRNGFTRDWWETLDREQRELVLDELADDELIDFLHDWRVWARENQLLPDGRWSTCLALAGRGWGKTRTAVEHINDEVKEARRGRICILGQGESDIREVMIEGTSGFLKTAHPDMRPTFQPSVGGGRLVWPNGAMGFVYSAEDPEALRGPEFDFAWFDEPMAVPAEKRQRATANLRFGLRYGTHPRLLYTTTPKPHRWLRDEVAKAKRDEHLPIEERRYVLIKGTTLENLANLPENFFEGIMDDYDGTNLGRQEIYAEILGEEEGALWTPDMLDSNRLESPMDADERIDFVKRFAETCDKVVVAVDPNMSSTSKTAHAAGIVICGARGRQRFVIDDWSTGGGPNTWGARAVAAYIEFNADEVVPEVNQGGDMVKGVVQGAADAEGVDVKVHMVRATRGKQRRAEPVSAAYARGIVKHVGYCGSTDRPGPFFKLETQMCALHDAHDPTGEDFDRCDAAVWGLTRLKVKGLAKAASSGNLPAIATMHGMMGING